MRYRKRFHKLEKYTLSLFKPSTKSNTTFMQLYSLLHHLYPFPASVSLQSARYLAALATAYHALLRTSPFRSLDNVLIVSSNCILLFLVRLLSLQNALQIIVVGQNLILKKLAVQFGATRVLDPGDIDISESMRLLTDDMGADIVFQISDQMRLRTHQRHCL